MLHLEDCPTIAYSETRMPLVSEAYPILLWHNILEFFRTHLTLLKDASITITSRDPNVQYRASGMMPQRYVSYILEEIVSNEQ